MIVLRNSGSPAVIVGNMVLRRGRLSLLNVQILAIRTTWHCIIRPKQSSLLELWHEKLFNIHERLRIYSIRLKPRRQLDDLNIFVLGVRTMLKPSMSASSTHRSNSSATCEGVPIIVAPIPPIVMCLATVCLVHFSIPGDDFDRASAIDLMACVLVSRRKADKRSQDVG